MDAIITGESERIGLSVIDNNDIEHLIEMNNSGVIEYHEQEGYPDDPAGRTVPEHEHVNQTRRFAQFYVYRERGYDTVEPTRNPDRIATAATAIANLPADRLDAWFGDSYRQIRSARGQESPVVDVSDTPLTTRVEQDVYLGLDEADATNVVEQLATDGVLDALQTAADSATTGGGLVNRLQSVFTEERVDVEESATVFGESVIEAVGPLAVRWSEAGTEREVVAEAEQPVPDRQPDVRTQLFSRAYEFEDLEAFRQSLVHHLLCQVRDCYVTMGIAPPADVRLQGPGFYEVIGWYDNHDVYRDYHEPDAAIDDWQEEYTPDDLLV